MSVTATGQPVTGQYSTQGVAQATGIPVTTILAWERRYGIPRPGRDDGGRRLYTQQDVELLRALRARTADGVRAEIAARELLAAPGEHRTARRPALTYLPTDVEELHCLHCGQVCGELLTQRGPSGPRVRFALLPGGMRPRRAAGGRARCGRCGGALYREPTERRTLPPFDALPTSPAVRQRGAA